VAENALKASIVIKPITKDLTYSYESIKKDKRNPRLQRRLGY